MPSYEPMLKTIQILQSLSDLEQEILLFMYDNDRKEFFILAGKRALIEVTVFSNCDIEVEIGEL